MLAPGASHPMNPSPINSAAIPPGVRPQGGLLEGRPLLGLLFRRAGYSRFVAVAKLALPLAAVALLTLVWAWPHLKATDLRFRIGFSDLVTRDGAEPNMLNPRYVGTDADRQPFALTSDVARVTASDRTKIDLEQPKGDMTLKDGTWLLLTAETGLFARTEKTVDLTGAVNLFHDSGYEIRTEKAFVDLEHGAAEGRLPVRGQGPFGDLRAEGFRLVDKGKVIHFTGKAKLVIFPGFRVNPS